MTFTHALAASLGIREAVQAGWSQHARACLELHEWPSSLLQSGSNVDKEGLRTPRGERKGIDPTPHRTTYPLTVSYPPLGVEAWEKGPWPLPGGNRACN